MRTIVKIFLTSILLSIVIFNESFSQFNFVHITDMHVSDGNSYVNTSDVNGVVFNQMLSTIRSLTPKPAFVVASGDLVNAGSTGNGAFPNFTQYLFTQQVTNPQPGDFFIDSAKTIPIYFTSGNHEYYTTLYPPLSTSGLVNYTTYIAPAIDYSITYNNAEILFLQSGYDSFRPLWIDADITNPEGSGLSDNQCSWLRTELSNSANMRKIIIIHHPPVDIVGTNADGTPSVAGLVIDPADGSILNNRTTFLNICDSNNVDITLSGHVHQNAVADAAGNAVNENWSGGTRYIQTAAGMFGAYRIITVDSSFVTVSTPLLLTVVGIPGYSAEDLDFSVYYNPASENISIFGGNFSGHANIEVGIFNIAGQEVIKQHFASDNELLHVVNASGLSKGFYLLTLRNGNKVFTKKLVVD